MKNQILTMITFVGFTISSLAPAQTREDALREALIRDAINKVRVVVKDYPLQGAKALSGLNLAKADEKYLNQALALSGDLPSILAEGSKIRFSLNSDTVEVNVLDAAAGTFRINHETFQYEGTQSLETNAKQIQKVLSHRSITLMDYIIPGAYALDAWVWGVIAALIAGIAVYMIVNNSDKKKAAEAAANKKAQEIQKDAHQNNDIKVDKEVIVTE